MGHGREDNYMLLSLKLCSLIIHTKALRGRLHALSIHIVRDINMINLIKTADYRGFEESWHVGGVSLLQWLLYSWHVRSWSFGNILSRIVVNKYNWHINLSMKIIRYNRSQRLEKRRNKHHTVQNKNALVVSTALLTVSMSNIVNVVFFITKSSLKCNHPQKNISPYSTNTSSLLLSY